jgi:hypothetical protein
VECATLAHSQAWGGECKPLAGVWFPVRYIMLDSTAVAGILFARYTRYEK